MARLTLEGAEAFGRDLNRVGNEWKNMSDQGKAAARDVGGSLTGIGASLVAVTALAAKAAIDWETAWTGVTKTVDGTPAQLKAVEQGLRDMTGVLPAAHGEIAAVAEAAGQLGIATENVVAFTRTMIDLGETTNLTSEEAAQSLARFMNVMGTSQDEVSNLGSSIVDLGNNYATTEADILAMASRLSGAARQIGLSEGATLGLAAALSAVGIEAEAGGSAMSKVMIDIAASVEKGGDRLDQFAKISGMSAADFTKQWKTNPGAALSAFVKGLADAESQGKSTFGMLEELGITEVRMRDALLRSAAAADDFSAAMGKGNTAFDENLALAAEAEKRYATVESQIGIMSNRVNDAAISFGQVFLPAIAAVVGGIADFADMLGGMPAPLQGLVGGLGVAAGAVALFGGMAVLTIPKIIELRAAMTLLGKEAPVTAGRVGVLTRSLGVLAGAVTAVFVVDQLAKMIADGLGPSAEETTNKLTTATDAVDAFRTAITARYKKDMGLEEAQRQLDGLKGALADAAANSANFADGISAGNEEVLATVKLLGQEYGALAATDLPAAQEKFRALAESQGLTATEQWRLLRNMPELEAELLKVATVSGDAADKGTLLALANGEGADKAQTAGEAYLEQADKAAGLRDAVDELLGKIMEMNGIGQDAVSANIAWGDALAGVDEHIQKAREGVEGYSLGLDQTTQVGRDNMGMLNDLAGSYQNAAEKQLALDGDTDAYQATLAAGRDAVLTRAADIGATAEQVKYLSDHIVAMPSEKDIKILADASDAIWTVERFIEATNQRWARVRIAGVAGSGGGLTQADGGVVKYFANGGREHHVAQIARAGVTRVWAEPETEGETYIPHARSKRARSEEILRQTAEEFGFDLTRTGERRSVETATAAPRRGGDRTVIIQNPITRDPLRDAQEIADILGAENDV